MDNQTVETKLVKVTVTKEDIQKGRFKNGERCPIARAAKRVLKNVNFVARTKIDFLSRDDEGLTHVESHHTSRAASRFVRAFDNGGKVKPFTFQMRVPTRFVR